MGEGHIQKFTTRVRARVIASIFFAITLLLGMQWILQRYLDLNDLTATMATLGIGLIVALILGSIVGQQLAKPTEYLAQAILHISPSQHLVSAPNLDKLRFGRELVANLTRQVYDYAATSSHDSKSLSSEGIIDQLPISIIGLDEHGVIILANKQAMKTIKLKEFVGQPLHSTLRLLTEDETTLESWLKASGETSLTAARTWQKTELKTVNDDSLGYFDIAASFSKHNASGIETLLALYDHSDAYHEETASISFVAMAVHELRSPLTIMRGYIDAFEDELGSNVTPQIADDLRKMNASAEYLTSFVSKILNVARADQGQLSLNLQEESWNTALPEIINTLRNRAEVYGKTIELRMQPDLPSVAVDRVTIAEVVTNLVDNAIKYTPAEGVKITVVSQVNTDGLIETTVRDQGVGIPSSVMPNIFSKFQRNHRNRAQIKGTGLGLYVSKAIITAHHGNIWASSKEGEGSTFGFTLLPFSQLAKEEQTKNNEAIIRSSHGWIKNHSMQRH